MRKLLAAGCLLSFIHSLGAAATGDTATLSEILSFESQREPGFPRGWSGGPPETIFADNHVAHGGHWSARLERKSESSGAFSTITYSIPVNNHGKNVELRGFLRTEDVQGFVGLWMREDGGSGAVAFDNMQSRHLHGTTDWTEYSIKLPLKPGAAKLSFGVQTTGTGRAWVDDLTLWVDGNSIGGSQSLLP